MFLSAFTCDKMYNNDENNVPKEAVVRLATTAIPEKRIVIDRGESDRVASLPENDQLTVTHAAFGHVSAKKMHETAAVADGVPKYRDVDTWCTSCSKGKMHILPHPKNAWVERAAHRHDVWHIDLIGKFQSPSLGGNTYVVTIIDNYSRYCTAIPIKNTMAATVRDALKKCMTDL